MNKNNTYTFSQFALSEGFDKDADFEFLHTGKNTDPRYGDFRFSKEELEEMANNFNSDVRGVEIAVDINHDPSKRAYAWIKPGSMYVSSSSKLDGEYSLYGKLHRYSDEGEKMLKNGVYRYFSLEIVGKLTTVIKDIKKTFKNVITGLALTNTPVIKGLRATYSENLLPNTHNMTEFKALVTELLQKGHATLSEKEQVADLFVGLSKDQQGHLQTQLSEVDGLPEEPTEAPAEQVPDVASSAPETAPVEVPAEVPAEAQPEVPTVVETPVAALSEDASQQLAESMRLAEENKALKEQVAQFAEAIRGEKVAQQVKGLMLSEARPIGIAPGNGNANEARLKSLLMSLSESQAAELVSLLSEVSSVDFKEHGKNVGELSLSEKEALLDETADAVLAKNPTMPKHEAMAVAAKQLGLDKA